MIDLRALLTRAGEALKFYSNKSNYVTDSSAGSNIDINGGECARALHAEIIAALARSTYPFLPCPICNGVEGCDHTVPERERAACGLAALDDGWRDISTAPRDEKIEIRGTQGGMGREITHWRPLPLSSERNEM